MQKPKPEEGLAEEWLAILEDGIDARKAKERAEEEERCERLHIKLEDDEQKKQKRKDREYREISEHLRALKMNKFDVCLPPSEDRWWDTEDYRIAEFRELYERVSDMTDWVDFSCYQSQKYARGMLHVTQTAFRFILDVTRGRRYKVM